MPLDIDYREEGAGIVAIGTGRGASRDRWLRGTVVASMSVGERLASRWSPSGRIFSLYMSEITSCLSTALADRCTIERELGSGGMAAVYLAVDLNHHRIAGSSTTTTKG